MTNVAHLKEKLSSELLQIPGVTGVGCRASELLVYLTSDSDKVKAQVTALLSREAPGVQIEFVVSGQFRAAFA